MSSILFRNAAVLDAGAGELRPGCDVLVEDRRIREVSDRPIRASSARILDIEGRTLMPGLIDCHVHVVASRLDLAANERLPNVFVTLQAIPILRGMLARGFTSVRDAGGADWSLAQATATGLIEGPRVFPSGKALSQTGGHGDFRPRGERIEPCACSLRPGALARIVDGVDAVRLAVREEIQQGASQIKVLASGGVASPNDPIHYLGFSEDELRAIVEEAANAGSYVMAHAYTARAIRRAVDAGVRSIEHGNLVDAATARHVADSAAYAVPTTVVYEALASDGARFGFPAAALAKIEAVRQAGWRALEIWRDAGVPMGFGTDLLGELHAQQSREFAIRAEVLGSRAAIASATTIAAEILGRVGELGVIAAGALADILVVDGDPLSDIGRLEGQGRHMPVIMKDGGFCKNELAG